MTGRGSPAAAGRRLPAARRCSAGATAPCAGGTCGTSCVHQVHERDEERRAEQRQEQPRLEALVRVQKRERHEDQRAEDRGAARRLPHDGGSTFRAAGHLLVSARPSCRCGARRGAASPRPPLGRPRPRGPRRRRRRTRTRAGAPSRWRRCLLVGIGASVARLSAARPARRRRTTAGDDVARRGGRRGSASRARRAGRGRRRSPARAGPSGRRGRARARR